MLTFHASRSRYEAFQKCKRLGFLQYCFEGRGLQKRGRNIFLSTGIWTHKGLELVTKYVQKHSKLPEPYVVDMVVEQCAKGYFEYVFPQKEIDKGTVEGFDLVDERLDLVDGQRREMTDIEQQRVQQYTFNEQSALVEAFIRVYCLRILPRLWARFKIVTVENDMGFPFVSGSVDPYPNQERALAIDYEVIQSATIDIVLQERDTKDIYIVSFKTAGKYDNRTAKSNAHDTQGLSEIWAFEEFMRQRGTPKQAIGVQMIYFVKGNRAETESGSGVWETKNPLIKGYRRIGIEGVEYAHSWYFPNPNNKSGKGSLGRGWESFDVWDSDEVGGIKGWIEMLDSGVVQPECRDILAQQVIEPIPYYRKPGDVDSWLRQTKAEEQRIAEALIQFDPENLDEHFPQTRSHCHYPNDCSMLSICHGTGEERFRPLQGGYEYRVPHHKLELVQIEGKK